MDIVNETQDDKELVLEVKTKIKENGEVYPTKLDKETGEIKIVKKPFFAYEKVAHGYVEELSRRNPVASSVFTFLVNNMGSENALIVSYEAMMSHFQRGRRSLSDSIKYLKENKYISVLKSGNMNIYCINARIVWNQSQDKIHYAKFNAAVYVCKSEQMDKKHIKNSHINYTTPKPKKKKPEAKKPRSKK